MNIAEDTLIAEYERAHKEWPHIAKAEKKYDLPHMLLFAVGSRETNLTNETGDGGHGHGIFQLDDRSHVIPDPFPVHEQANIAARMLAGNIAQFGHVHAGVAAYNCGAGNVMRAKRAGYPVDYYTAGRDYSRDVVERMHALREYARHRKHEKKETAKETKKHEKKETAKETKKHSK